MNFNDSERNEKSQNLRLDSPINLFEGNPLDSDIITIVEALNDLGNDNDGIKDAKDDIEGFSAILM